ncbi:MAG: hypothetical protein RL173_29 [Fibrobacterota bacterium]|jgi:ParB family chromosome partitioning protein
MKSKPDVFGRALTAGAGLHKQEQNVTAVLANAQEHRLLVHEIRPRHNPATRSLDTVHVLDLAESIVALGLIEPVAVDTKHRLLAGGHRWAALRLIAATQEQRTSVWRELFKADPSPAMSERLGMLPVSGNPVAVHVLSIDSVTDPSTALGIDVAENCQRRNFSKQEIRALATTLKAAGYRDGVGRPKQGERTVIPALSAVLGKSRRAVYMMLASIEAGAEGAGIADKRKGQTIVVEDKRLKVALCRWLDTREVAPKARAMAEALLQYLSTLDEVGGVADVDQQTA